MKQQDYCISKVVVGALEVNCYILSSGSECYVIDPGEEATRIKALVKKSGCTVKGILFTHGHGDHIAAGVEFDVPLYIHRDDRACLFDPQKNLSAYISSPITYPRSVTVYDLADKEELFLGAVRISVLHTPGHTLGGVSFVCDGVVFSGDALFAGSVGRSDFPGGDHEVLIKSIKEQLLTLPDDTIVYPGHGPATTIGTEKGENTYLID